MSDASDGRRTPAQAWAELQAGNERFARGHSANADKDLARRAEVAVSQHPFALVFGCGDSRVSAEIVFDQGLGRLFVVRTAGHVVDSGVLGSVEFGVGYLSIPLVVVLGHDSCGAVSATIDAVESGILPAGFVRDIVERVTPSVLAAQRAGRSSTEEVEAEHVRQTVRLLVDRSAMLSDAVLRGALAVVGLVYALDDGRVSVVEVIGDVAGASDIED
ncbi:carbonic anhydrase [Angustibacter sp. McL0619]|uniref:carbonic anhydrase n=1 Tax=Angustibacter sp. McL0619 TaxID=3415676 RepID=UPI003CEAB9DB